MKKKPYGWKEIPPAVGTKVIFLREVLALEPSNDIIRERENGYITGIWSECEWVTVKTLNGKYWAGPFKDLKILLETKKKENLNKESVNH